MDLVFILFGILLFGAIVSIIVGIVLLISTKGKTGLKYILIGVLAIVIGVIVGFGTCVLALNGNIK